MTVADALIALLECASGELSVPVCRSFIHPGSRAPHDSCEESLDGKNGQLWVANTEGVGGWPPGASGLPITCATPFSETIEVGVVRCAMGKVRDDGTPPPPEDVTADAIQQQEDKDALKRAILCCWGLPGRDLSPPVWNPIEPYGGCVGGTWTVVIRDASCYCAASS